jgi:putative NADH-flavin reductase
MKISVFGAKGEIGSHIVSEAFSRGHDVMAVVRTEAQLGKLPLNVIGQAIDVMTTGEVARILSGQDLAISALRPPEGEEQTLVTLTQSILDAAAASGVRVIVVGGAASLKLPDGSGHTVLTAPGFLPASVVPIAQACQAQYEHVIAETKTEWSYICPPAMLVPGKRTGRYCLGDDELVMDEKGVSSISMEDFAVAVLDEAERAKHTKRRFTVSH